VAAGPLLLLGTLSALALLVENGHESWSALYLQDVLNAGPATAATGPAVFAAVMAITRLGAGRLSTRRPGAVLLTGSATAAIGTALVGAAPSVPAGWLGLAIAAAGTGVLFPTVLGVLSARVPEHVRGSATSIVTTIAYVGFLVAPVYVGRWADIAGLRGAMFALAALAAGLAPITALTLRSERRL
jgi:MFS family permease